MHSGRLLSAMACLVSLVSSIEFTNWPTTLQIGKPAMLQWSGNPKTPVTITLQEGPSNNLKDVEVLTANGQGGSFTWTPDTALSRSTNYAFKIEQAHSVNYSGSVQVSGDPAQASTAKTASMTEAPLHTASVSPTGTMASSMTTAGSMAKSRTTSASIITRQSGSSSTITKTSTSTSTASHKSAPVSIKTNGAATTAATELAKTNAGSTLSTGKPAGTQDSANSASVQQRSLGLVLGVVGLVVYHI